MTGTLNLTGVGVDFALGETEVLVTAPIVQHIDAITNPNDHQHPTANLQLSSLTVLEVFERSDVVHGHAVTVSSAARTDETSDSTSDASSDGRVVSIS